MSRGATEQSRTKRVDIAIDRQFDAIDRANSLALAAKRRIEMLQRLLWRVPFHEWEEAKRRGPQAVYLLLEAYAPGNARYLRDEGRTPRCPPWASRKYRQAAYEAGFTA